MKTKRNPVQRAWWLGGIAAVAALTMSGIALASGGKKKNPCALQLMNPPPKTLTITPCDGAMGSASLAIGGSLYIAPPPRMARDPDGTPQIEPYVSNQQVLAPQPAPDINASKYLLAYAMQAGSSQVDIGWIDTNGVTHRSTLMIVVPPSN
jgi:hypothetical protein